MEDRTQVIGITGSKGLLGSELMKLPGAIALEGDITDPNVIREWPQVDYIINCAAKTNVDWCESHPEQAWSTNWMGVRNLIELCKRTETKLIQISSEMSIVPSNVYGASKFAADTLIKNNLSGNSIIIYTSHLFGNSPASKRTFPKWIVEKIEEGHPFEVANYIYCRPTWTRDVHMAIDWAIVGGYRGELVVAGPEYVSKFDHAQLIEILKTGLNRMEDSLITPTFKSFGAAPRESVDLWTKGIPRFSNTTSLKESTKIFLRELQEES